MPFSLIANEYPLNRIHGFTGSIVNSIINFVAPHYCEVCKKLIIKETSKFEFICNACYDNIPLAPEPAEIINRLLVTFGKDDLAVSSAYCLLSIKEDHDFMELIYSLKYSGFFRIGLELGYELGRLLEIYKATDYDVIVPVPIHHARMRERGFNQSDYIAKGISKVIDKEINTQIIKRKRYTQTQTVLSKSERRNNISKAIEATKHGIDLNEKKILLVDDVLTTGSTLNTCAEKLLENGAKRVDVATIVLA